MNFDISDPDGNEVKMWWSLTFEHGQWRIDNYNNDPDDPNSPTVVSSMEKYLEENEPI